MIVGSETDAEQREWLAGTWKWKKLAFTLIQLQNLPPSLYARYYTETGDGVHLRGLAPG